MALDVASSESIRNLLQPPPPLDALAVQVDGFTITMH